MNRSQLRSLILKRMDEFDRLHECDDPDPQEFVAGECAILYDIADKMARAGFHRLHTIGLTLGTDDDPVAVKNYLSRCLRALRSKRRCAATSPNLSSDCLTVIQAATVAGVGKRTIYKLCEMGRLPHHRVGTGRGTIRVKRNDLDRYLQQNRVECQSPAPEKDYLFS